MKKISTFIVVYLCMLQFSNSQVILFQTFASNSNTWVTSNGSSTGSYDNPDLACAQDFGIRTPGVGGNNPAKILSEIITPSLSNLTIQFSISRFDANLTCASRSNFGCDTYVDIILVSSAYSGIDPIGDGATIYANHSGYLLPIAGGAVSLNVALSTLAPFKVFFNFSTPGNCNQGGTKYVLDEVKITQFTPCASTGTCPPVANDDYFNATTQGFTSGLLKGNVYGSNLGYTPPPANITNVTRSLTNAFYSALGGLDADVDNHALTAMNFTLLTQSFTNADATINFRTDGTFDFTRINNTMELFTFTYRLTDPTSNFDDALVTIDFRTPVTLPVHIKSFSASIHQSSKVKLMWEAATNTNNAGFEVERKTSNGVFENIGSVPVNSDNTLHYSYIDNSVVPNGVILYRLKQTDRDGKITYSEIRSAKFGANKFEVSTYPNPSKGFVNILIPNDAGAVSISIVNVNGKLVQSLQNTLLRKVSFEALQTGVYTVIVEDLKSRTISSTRLIVQ